MLNYFLGKTEEECSINMDIKDGLFVKMNSNSSKFVPQDMHHKNSVLKFEQTDVSINIHFIAFEA